MSNTRRGFLQSTASLAAGLASSAVSLPAQQTGGRRQPAPLADSEINIPKVKFGKYQISRMILGVNPFYGFSHYNSNFSTMMAEFYRPARVVEVLQRCEKYGVNAYNYVHMNRAFPDWEMYKGEGGKMHLIAQATTDDPAELWKAVQPMGAWAWGESTDKAYRAGKLDTVRDYCKKLRDAGVEMVGIASHMPEVLATVADKDWDIDFYAGAVYNIRRTPQELRALLGGELPEMPGDVYLQDDPDRMYKVFRQISKPCVAYKILGAGRVSNVTAAFKRCFSSIKPNDLVCVGMCPRAKDEVKENVEIVTRLLSAS
jgi:hypothetical protein